MHTLTRVVLIVMHWTPDEVWNLEYERIRASWNFSAKFFTIVLIPHDRECPENDLWDCRLILKLRKCSLCFFIFLVARLVSQFYFITWKMIFRFDSHWQLIVCRPQNAVLERISWFSTFFYLNSDFWEFLRLLFYLYRLSQVYICRIWIEECANLRFCEVFLIQFEMIFLILMTITLFAAVILCKWFCISRSCAALLRSTSLAQLQSLNLANIRILGLTRNFSCLYNSDNCVFLRVSFNSSCACRQVAWPIKSGALGPLFVRSYGLHT